MKSAGRALEIPANPRTGLDVSAFEDTLRAQPVRAIVITPLQALIILVGFSMLWPTLKGAPWLPTSLAKVQRILENRGIAYSGSDSTASAIAVMPSVKPSAPAPARRPISVSSLPRMPLVAAA